MRQALFLVCVVGLVACTPGGERDVDRSAVGPKATAGAVSITYPPDTAPLTLNADDLVAGWNGAFAAELGTDTAVARASRIEAGSVTDPISLEAIVDTGAVVVAQLAVVDGAGDDDQARSTEAIQRFLGLLFPSSSTDADAAFVGLGFGESGALFALSENAFQVGAVTIYRASNEDTILVGAVASP